jgi:hypothetical protein
MGPPAPAFPRSVLARPGARQGDIVEWDQGFQRLNAFGQKFRSSYWNIVHLEINRSPMLIFEFYAKGPQE